MLETLNKYTLIFLLFFLPLLFPPVFTDLYDAPKILFFYFGSFILIFLFAFLIRLKKEVFLPDKNFLILLGLFGFVYLLSSVFSIHPLTSFIGLWNEYGTYTGGFIHLLVLILVFLAVLQLELKNCLEKIASYLTASGVLVSLYGIFQYIPHFLKGDLGFRIRSTIGQPNKLGLFLITVLPLSISLFLKQKRPLLKFIYFLNSLVIITTVFLTLSRTAWLTFLLLLFIVLLTNIKNCQAFIKKNKNYLILSTILFLLFFLTFGGSVILRTTSIVNDIKNQNGSFYFRLLELKTGVIVYKNQPLIRKIIGSGPETIIYSFLPYRPVEFNQFAKQKNSRMYILPNQYLHYLNTIGIAGLLFYLLIILSVVKDYFKNKSKDIFKAGFFYSWLTIVISSFFYFQTTISFFLFWIYMSFIINLKSLNKYKFHFSFISKTLLGFLIIFSFLGLGLVFLFSKALIYAKQKNFEKAAGTIPSSDYFWREQSLHLQKKAFDEDNPEMMKQSINTAEKAYKINSLEPSNFASLHSALYSAAGYLKMDKKYQEQALILAQKWAETDPSNPAAFDSLGLSFLDLGKLDDAQTNFEKALKLDGDYRVSYLHMGEALKQKGKVEKAIEYYRLALGKYPDWQEAKKELDKALILLDN